MKPSETGKGILCCATDAPNLDFQLLDVMYSQPVASKRVQLRQNLVLTRIMIQRSLDFPERHITLNDVICFIQNKYHNYLTALIKSAITEFYRED